MDYLSSYSEITLDGYTYTVDDMCGEIWSFLDHFSDQVMSSNKIPVNTND